MRINQSFDSICIGAESLCLSISATQFTSFEWGGFTDPAACWVVGTENTQGAVRGYQELWNKTKHLPFPFEYFFFIHDDVSIYEPGWVNRVEKEFADPDVAVVGLGGAEQLGAKDLYKHPYKLQRMARERYWSNQQDWQIHGKQLIGARDVAVLDGFFLGVRKEFMLAIDGWEGFPFLFHGYDLYLCLMAAEWGKRVRAVGVECRHWGGGTSTKEEYQKTLRNFGVTGEEDHQAPHRWLWERFKEVLPVCR